MYTVADAEQAIRLLASQDYDRPFQPLPGVTATFVEAGHILGSAGIVLELDEKGHKVRLMFSGDIGRPGMPILRDPVLPGDVDYLLMECTYGDTPHDPPEKAYEALRSVISRTVGRGGKIIIPSFAIGRTQLLVYELHEMIDRREVPRIPVYVDSPMAVNATEIFKDHPEIFDQQTQEFIRTDSHRQALGFDLLTYTQSVEESKAINDLKGPLVIISASGMAETGRILHHLRNNIQDPKNTILITSWMAPDTLGRRLADGQKRGAHLRRGIPGQRRGGQDRRLLGPRRSGFSRDLCPSRAGACQAHLPGPWGSRSGSGFEGQAVRPGNPDRLPGARV